MDEQDVQRIQKRSQNVIIGAGIAIFVILLISVVIVKRMRNEYALKEASITARLAQLGVESGELEGRLQELLDQADKEYSEKQQLANENVDQGRDMRELRESYDEKIRLISVLYKEEMQRVEYEKAEIRRNMIVVSDGAGAVRVDLEDLRVKCNATEEQLNKLLESTNLAGHGWDFLAAEHTFDVNAIVLMSIMKQESGLGKETIASFNSAGMKTGTGEWRSFESFSECINELASLLNRQYLNENGRFYNGMSITDVNIRYCLNLDGTIDWGWSAGITVHVAGFVEKANG